MTLTCRASHEELLNNSGAVKYAPKAIEWALEVSRRCARPRASQHDVPSASASPGVCNIICLQRQAFGFGGRNVFGAPRSVTALTYILAIVLAVWRTSNCGWVAVSVDDAVIRRVVGAGPAVIRFS